MLLKIWRTLHVPQTLIHKYILKMDKAYLRLVPDDDLFLISFRYTDAPRKLDRQFNFSRQFGETIAAFTHRISANVEKVVNKKKKKLEEKVSVDVTLYSNGEKIDEERVCRDVFTPCSDVTLKLLQTEFKVVMNAPYIDNVSLPDVSMPGFPMYPFVFDATNVNLDDSKFEWYKSRDLKEWTECGSGFTYTPNCDDVDCYLKLICWPRQGDKEGPAAETCMGRTVAATPGVFPFEKRHQFTKQKCSGDEFRVVTYNILADLYCDSEHTRTELYPYCPPHALAIDYRKQLVIKELTGYNADIMCLQEVDGKIYNRDFNSYFSRLGYDSHFTLKGGGVAEGLACFYNSRFRFLKSYDVVLSEHLDQPIFAGIAGRVGENPELKERLLERKTALQIVVLLCEDGTVLLVANTHLYFHPDADHIRLLQGSMCVKYVEDVYNNLMAEYKDHQTFSILFCGDFNSTPECGIYKLYTSGSIGTDCIDWESNKSQAVTDLTVNQPFKFASACGTPPYTNFTVGFADCLDYIFYDTTKLKVTQAVPLPSEEELKQNAALPSVVFPSDHVSLVADLKWCH